MIVVGTSLTTRGLPSTAGSRLKRLCQYDQLITDTAGAGRSDLVVLRTNQTADRRLQTERLRRSCPLTYTPSTSFGPERRVRHLKTAGRHRHQIGEHVILVAEALVVLSTGTG